MEPSVEGRCIALIPAFDPDERLLHILADLRAAESCGHVVVVDDGSGPHCRDIFQRVRRERGVTLLEHALNLGKGAALKTGINHTLCRHPEAAGIVTADADGQHLAEDIRRVATALGRQPTALVIGVRTFDGPVPLRSRFGNAFTRLVFRLLVGSSLADTQSGLRGIPIGFARRLLRSRPVGYDFELEMLVVAREEGLPLREVPIATVYEPGNASSHFDPLRDSLAIYFVFLRFLLASLVTSVVSLVGFQVTWVLTGNLVASEVVLRLVGVGINFYLCRGFVFRSRARIVPAFVRFLGLVVALGFVCYHLTLGMVAWLEIGVLPARILTALIVYLANFAIQRDFVFRARHLSRESS